MAEDEVKSRMNLYYTSVYCDRGEMKMVGVLISRNGHCNQCERVMKCNGALIGLDKIKRRNQK